MAETWQIRLERPEDAARVESLDNDGFGSGRFAKTAYRLREGVEPERTLCFVAVENSTVLGSVRFWPIVVGAEKHCCSVRSPSSPISAGAALASP